MLKRGFLLTLIDLQLPLENLNQPVTALVKSSLAQRGLIPHPLVQELHPLMLVDLDQLLLLPLPPLLKTWHAQMQDFEHRGFVRAEQ